MTTRRQFVYGALAAPVLRAASVEEGPVRILSTPGGGIQPQLSIAENALHLVYYSGDARHGDVFYVRSSDYGRTFTDPIRVNSQPGSAIAAGAIRGAQIAVGKGNRVHVAWNGSDVAEPAGPINPEAGKPGSPMLYARLNPGGTAFEPQRNLMRQTFGLDGGGSVAADRAGNVFVAWHGKAPGAAAGEAGRQVWIARSADEGGSFAPEHPATTQPTGACGCCGLRVFADSRGVIYGLYRSATQNVHRDIYLLRSSDAGKSFSDFKLHTWDINACPMSSMDLIEADGEVLGAWETQAQVYFAPVSGDVAASRKAIATPPGENPKRKYPSLARNRKGETLLAWVEGSGWQKAGTLGWQIFDPKGRPTASSTTARPVPVWSFPAAFTAPDDRFRIVV